MPNMYYCSDGRRVSEATIKANYTKAIREKYAGNPVQICQGCQAAQANGSAHIVPKARLKVLHLTELIWHPIMFFPACNRCNTICENPASEAITELKNYSYVKIIIERFDPERATKLLK